MMKLTKKEFISKLKGTAFIASVWDKDLSWILNEVSKAKTIPIIYNVIEIVERSKDIICIKDNGEKSYRDFVGSNQFYQDKDLLVHVNTLEGHTVTMLNI